MATFITRERPSRKKEDGGAFTAFVVLLLLAIPTFVTFVAPVSVVHFTRGSAGIHAESSGRILFLIPFRHVAVDGVTKIESQLIEGTYSRDYNFKDYGETRSEDQAFLYLLGRDGQHARVAMDAAHATHTLQEARAIFAPDGPAELTITTVANRLFGIYLAAGLCLPPLAFILVILDKQARRHFGKAT